MALQVYECQATLSWRLRRLQVLEQRDPERVPHEPGGQMSDRAKRAHDGDHRNARLAAWRRPKLPRWTKSSLFASGAVSSFRAPRSTADSLRPTTTGTTACS